MKKRREVEVIRRWMRKNFEGWWYKIPDVGLGRKPFDVVACKKGKFIAIEFKKKGGVVLPHQAESLHEVKKNGGKAYIAWWEKKKGRIRVYLEDFHYESNCTRSTRGHATGMERGKSQNHGSKL